MFEHNGYKGAEIGPSPSWILEGQGSSGQLLEGLQGLGVDGETCLHACVLGWVGGLSTSSWSEAATSGAHMPQCR